MLQSVDKRHLYKYSYCYLRNYADYQLKFTCMRAVKRAGMENGKKDILYREMYSKYTEYLNLSQQGFMSFKVTGDMELTPLYPDSFYTVLPGHQNIGVTFEQFKNYILKQRGLERKRKKVTVRSSESLSRTKSRIFELALCNNFDYFATFTFSGVSFDRKCLKDCYSAFANFIRVLNRKDNFNVRYLLIPEKHKSGDWHLHGLIKGLPASELHEFCPDDWDLSKGHKIPKYIINAVKKGRKVYHWTTATKKFGWNTFESVRSAMAVSKYITKYITKDFALGLEREADSHLYYCSKGLSRAKLCKAGFLVPQNFLKIQSDVYMSDYCCSYTVDYSDDTLNLLSSCISDSKEIGFTGYSPDFDGFTCKLKICKGTDICSSDVSYRTTDDYKIFKYIQKYPEIAGDFEKIKTIRKFLCVSDGQVQVLNDCQQDYTDFIDRIYPPVQLRLLE